MVLSSPTPRTPSRRRSSALASKLRDAAQVLSATRDAEANRSPAPLSKTTPVEARVLQPPPLDENRAAAAPDDESHTTRQRGASAPASGGATASSGHGRRFHAVREQWASARALQKERAQRESPRPATAATAGAGASTPPRAAAHSSSPASGGREVLAALSAADVADATARRGLPTASGAPPAAASAPKAASSSSAYPPMAFKAPSALPFASASAPKAAPSAYPPMASKAPSALPFKTAAAAAPPAAVAAATPGATDKNRARLVAFYEQYNASKLGTVDATLAKYAGREGELFAQLHAKYVAAAGGLPASRFPAAAGSGATVFLEVRRLDRA